VLDKLDPLRDILFASFRLGSWLIQPEIPPRNLLPRGKK